MHRTLLTFAVMAWVALPAMAQDQTQRRRGAGFGGAGTMGQIMLLRDKSVREELKLTDEQVKKLDDAQARQRESFQGLRDLSQEERRQKGQELAKESEKTLKEILNADQTKRLKQISLQQQGLRALADEEVAKLLSLTDEQKEKLKTIQEENRRAFQGIDREGFREKFQELRKTNDEKLQTLLTGEQKSKWKELTGEPFKGEIRPFEGFQRRRNQ